MTAPVVRHPRIGPIRGAFQLKTEHNPVAGSDRRGLAQCEKCGAVASGRISGGRITWSELPHYWVPSDGIHHDECEGRIEVYDTAARRAARRDDLRGYYIRTVGPTQHLIMARTNGAPDRCIGNVASKADAVRLLHADCGGRVRGFDNIEGGAA